MGDIRTTSYQGEEIEKLTGNDEQVFDIYRNLPDQFWQYDNMNYNPLDFFTASGDFNLALFNKTYRDEQLRRMNYYNDLEKKRLEELNALQEKQPDLLGLTIGEHLIKMKDAPFQIYNDLVTQPINSDILLKNNRLFYIGLFFIMIMILYVILSNLIDSA